MLSFRTLARQLRRLHGNYPSIFPAAKMDESLEVNEGSDTPADSEKAKSTSVDGGPPEENGAQDSPPVSAADNESRATGPEPSSGSPERSRHTKTSPPSKASGRSSMPPLKKFFSTDSWFRKKQGKLQGFGVSPRRFSLPFTRDPGIW